MLQLKSLEIIQASNYKQALCHQRGVIRATLFIKQRHLQTGKRHKALFLNKSLKPCTCKFQVDAYGIPLLLCSDRVTYPYSVERRKKKRISKTEEFLSTDTNENYYYEVWIVKCKIELQINKSYFN